MAETRILVVLGNERWTNQAMHLACAMARNEHTSVALVRPVPVANPEQLGNVDFHPDHTQRLQRTIHEISATAEDYQVSFEVIQLHYSSYINGIRSAAEELNAMAVFAPLSKHRLKIIDRFQTWRFHRALSCPLFTLDPDDRTGRDENLKQANQPMNLPEAHFAPKN